MRFSPAQEVPRAVAVGMEEADADAAAAALAAVTLALPPRGGERLSPEPSGDFHPFPRSTFAAAQPAAAATGAPAGRKIVVAKRAEKKEDDDSHVADMQHDAAPSVSAPVAVALPPARKPAAPKLPAPAPPPAPDSPPPPAASASTPADLDSIVERFLAPGVKYFRQQDLGDLWVEMLEEELRPPWGPPDVLRVLNNHSTTFWDILSREELQWARAAERHLRLRPERRQDAGSATARHLHAIMGSLLAGLERPRSNGTDAPDPSEIPFFVSLGDARAALQAGLAELAPLLP